MTAASFTYIRRDDKGKPYTIHLKFAPVEEDVDVIAVMVQEVDEESGFQRIDNYYIREGMIGTMKDQRFNAIESEGMEELKGMVLARL